LEFKSIQAKPHPHTALPTKSNTAGRMGGQELKMLTMGNCREAADKSQSREAGQLLNRVLRTLCCFTAKAGIKPKENNIQQRERNWYEWAGLHKH